MPQRILLVSQVYAPDPAAVARLVADVGSELARRGHHVIVLTADRGYDDPSVRYATTTTPDGVFVRRLPFCSFGKGSMALRVLGGLSFTLQAALLGLTLRGIDTLVVSTSPPMAALAAVIVHAIRRVRVVYWPMDLNPDQAVTLGLANPRSLTVRALEWLNRAVLRRAQTVIALDHAMARRLREKQPVGDKLEIVPPWPEEDGVAPVPHDENPFRRQHALDGKRVVMYSGTLGPSNPVSTLLAAAEQFEGDPRLVLLFIGGGTGMAEVKARNRPNVRCLPYEPLARMRYSLSAGDVQVVSLGDEMAGIVHPCKVYGAMGIARPILFLGPPDSHVSEMMAQADFGWQVRHGDVAGAVAALRAILAADAGSLTEKGARARALIETNRTRRISSGRVADAIEGTKRPIGAPSGRAEGAETRTGRSTHEDRAVVASRQAARS
jgi:glycosyltransferase involved in cell wall biosynthesis